MTIESRLANHYEQNLDSMAMQLVDILRQSGQATYRSLDEATLMQLAQAPFRATIEALRGNIDALTLFSYSTISRRAQEPNFSSEFIGALGNILYDILTTEMSTAFPENETEQAKAQVALAQLTFESNKASYQAYVDIRQQQLEQREAELLHIQQEYEQMSTAIRELSAPIAPIHDNVLVLPLVGSIDTSRAQTITEDLLEEIVERQTDLIIIDITGVPVVDTNIANYLLQTTKAVNLLGAQVILVGISAEVAQTIVGLDLDLRQLTVRANLQDGIEYALAQMGLGIRELDTQPVYE